MKLIFLFSIVVLSLTGYSQSDSVYSKDQVDSLILSTKKYAEKKAGEARGSYFYAKGRKHSNRAALFGFGTGVTVFLMGADGDSSAVLLIGSALTLYHAFRASESYRKAMEALFKYQKRRW